MELKELFLVSFDGKMSVMNQKDIDYCHRYRASSKTEIVIVEELGKMWPKNAIVEESDGGSGRCWVWQNYKITADEKLIERDMEVIRAQYPFLSGQDTAKVDLSSFKEVDGKFIYKAHSECDSGD